jgi:hypothetical protein
VQAAFDECPKDPGGGATPSFTDAQGYLTQFTYDVQWGGIPPSLAMTYGADPCGLTTTLLGFDGSGWDLDALWEFGNLLIDLSGGDKKFNGARGNGIRVGIIEHTAFADWDEPEKTHEDLRGKVIAEPDQTIILNPSSPDSALHGDHGTACLGIVGAIDHGTPGHSIDALGGTGVGGPPVSDEIGMVGIAPEADLYFFPIISLEEGGRLLNAWSNAIDAFEEGDVLSFSIGPGDGCGGPDTLVSTAANWTMARLSADAGITVCIAAGNECCNLDSTAQFQGLDSDAIIVGAGWPGNTHCRLGFSNHCVACEGANQVHCQAWGSNVSTLGYGDLFFGADPANDDGHKVRSYTTTFGGTSAACPQVAGLVACMQGISKQVWGIPLMPDQIRGILNNGSRQCDLDVPPGPADDPCLGDFDFEAEPARIRNYPNAVLSGEGVVSADLTNGNELIDDILVIRGDLVHGNKFSITQNDGNYLVLDSVFTFGDYKPPFEPPAGLVQYLVSADTVDLMVLAHSDTKDANSMTVTTAVEPPGVVSFMFVEIFDWEADDWIFVDFFNLTVTEETELTCPPDWCTAHAAINPNRFINQISANVYIRLYFVGMGGGPAGESDASFTQNVDLVDLNISTGFGQGNPGDL